MSFAIYPKKRHDRPHARLYDHHLAHAAWISLSGNAFMLLTYLLAKYRPEMPNSFPVGQRTVSLLIGVSPKTGSKLVDELIEKGHLREERKGRGRGCTKTRERVVSLTRYDTDLFEGNPDLPIEVWKRRQTAQTLPRACSKNSGLNEKTPSSNSNNGSVMRSPLS